MEAIVGNERIEINVPEVVRMLDDVFHREITDNTGILVSHNDINAFVSNIIIVNNMKEIVAMEDLREGIAKCDAAKKRIEEKIKNGKVVYGIDTITEKFKYYVLGYYYVKEDVEGDKDE